MDTAPRQSDGAKHEPFLNHLVTENRDGLKNNRLSSLQSSEPTVVAVPSSKVFRLGPSNPIPV
jgi:hypothetical protein